MFHCKFPGLEEESWLAAVKPRSVSPTSSTMKADKNHREDAVKIKKIKNKLKKKKLYSDVNSRFTNDWALSPPAVDASKTLRRWCCSLSVSPTQTALTAVRRSAAPRPGPTHRLDEHMSTRSMFLHSSSTGGDQPITGADRFQRSALIGRAAFENVGKFPIYTRAHLLQSILMRRPLKY